MTNRDIFGIISKSSRDGAIAGMAQSVEHVIGNDEVISSILITSSNPERNSVRDYVFSINIQPEATNPVPAKAGTGDSFI